MRLERLEGSGAEYEIAAGGAGGTSGHKAGFIAELRAGTKRHGRSRARGQDFTPSWRQQHMLKTVYSSSLGRQSTGDK